PYRSISPEKVRRPLAWTISNSSVRDWEKCSHNAFETSTPSAVSNCDSRGTHDPHEVPAAVQPFRSATVQAPSAMAEHRSALVTLLQEQIWASSGSAPTPIAVFSPAGAIRATGSPGSAEPTRGRSTP